MYALHHLHAGRRTLPMPSCSCADHDLHFECHLCLFRPSHNPSIDSIPLEYLMAPSAVLALIFHPSWSLTDLLWSFSIYLEAVAILPQLFLLQRTGEAEAITAHYLFALGAYRALYLVNWLYILIFHGTKGFNTYGFLAGLVQTALYADFFYSTSFVGVFVLCVICGFD